jgi:hypothetical protein
LLDKTIVANSIIEIDDNDKQFFNRENIMNVILKYDKKLWMIIISWILIVGTLILKINTINGL